MAAFHREAIVFCDLKSTNFLNVLVDVIFLVGERPGVMKTAKKSYRCIMEHLTRTIYNFLNDKMRFPSVWFTKSNVRNIHSLSKIREFGALRLPTPFNTE